MENVEQKETAEVTPKMYTKEKGKIYNEDLQIVLSSLTKLEQKNPIAYEISRAVKATQGAIEKFNEAKSKVMEEHLLRDADGNYVLKDEVKEAMAENDKIQPTVYSYEVEGDEKAYQEALLDVFKADTGITFKSIDASKKMVQVDGKKEPLLEVISDYFGAGEIAFLEAVNILTGLD